LKIFPTSTGCLKNTRVPHQANTEDCTDLFDLVNMHDKISEIFNQPCFSRNKRIYDIV